MFKSIIISILVLGCATSKVQGQAAPAPEGIASCQDVLAMEAETLMDSGWSQAGKRQIEGGGLVYMWVKGEAARLLLFAPEAAGNPPKGNMFKLLGRCEYKGEVRIISRGLLGGEHG